MSSVEHVPCGAPGSTEPMYGVGDLAVALGGSADSFIGRLLLLIAKTDPTNRDRLRLGFPREVLAYELWMLASPTPTGDQLLAVLDGLAPDG